MSQVYRLCYESVFKFLNKTQCMTHMLFFTTSHSAQKSLENCLMAVRYVFICNTHKPFATTKVQQEAKNTPFLLTW